ncbi:MAG: hypothetical protein Q4A81_03360 [Pasteurellaceae bacterium]|nr:hypothetical protein [Pasteurellaceae bacterium]
MKIRRYIRAMLWIVILSPVVYGGFVALDWFSGYALEGTRFYRADNTAQYYFFTDKFIKKMPEQQGDIRYFYRRYPTSDTPGAEESGTILCQLSDLAQTYQQLKTYAQTSHFSLQESDYHQDLSHNQTTIYLHQTENCVELSIVR